MNRERGTEEREEVGAAPAASSNRSRSAATDAASSPHARRSRGFVSDLIEDCFGEASARWWASRSGRRARSVALPIIACVCVVSGLLAYPPSYQAGLHALNSFYTAIMTRPELRIRSVAILGANRVDEADIVRALDLKGDDRAALTVDAAAARERVETLGWVEKARVSLRPPQTLEVEIWERTPTMLWREGGRLKLLDAKNVLVAEPLRRSEWPHLPMIVGRGADQELDEALALDRAARLAGLPIVALTRVGRRRWDIELVDGPRIMLPEGEPFGALERAIDWVAEYRLLDRQIETVGFAAAFCADGASFRVDRGARSRNAGEPG